jgi:large subunit ribosomal protein L5
MQIYNKIKNNSLSNHDKTTLDFDKNSHIFYPLYTSPNLQRYYQDIICQDLCLKQNYKNIMECSSLNQIVCNTSSKHYLVEKESILPASSALEMITGQKPKYTCAKKSISSFKLRQNQILGCKVHLRGEIMYRFLEKYISIVATRAKDWVSMEKKSQKSGLLDQNPNRVYKRTYNQDFVVQNSNLFPELQQHDEYFQNVTGIQISLSTTSRFKEKTKDGILLYSAFQMPK